MSENIVPNYAMNIPEQRLRRTGIFSGEPVFTEADVFTTVIPLSEATTAEAEKEVVPAQEIDKDKAALTELFNGAKINITDISPDRY